MPVDFNLFYKEVVNYKSYES